MARQHKDVRIFQIIAYSSAATLIAGILILALIGIDWNSAATTLLGIIFAGFALYSVFHFFRIVYVLYRKSKQRELMATVQTVGAMRTLTPIYFEHYVATLYEQQGYAAKVTPQSNDSGIDIILSDDRGTTGVQVKRYTAGQSVGRPDVQKLVGACSKRHARMLFVTTTDFTHEAYVYANEQDVQLVNGAALEKMAERLFGKDVQNKTFAFGFHRRMLTRR